jgi:hypothetical protein
MLSLLISNIFELQLINKKIEGWQDNPSLFEVAVERCLLEDKFTQPLLV